LASKRVERRLAAILAADVAGYSRLTGLDEEGTHVQLQDHLRTLVDPKIAEHRGRVVKNTGDGLLAEFSSVVEAVRCALDVQRGMAERNAEVPDEKRIEFRIGINVGDIIIDRGDIFGDGVNVAARLEGLAKPGSICIADDAYRQVRGKFDVTFEDAGEQQLKNIAQPVRVFRVALDDSRPAKSTWPRHNAVPAVRGDRWSARVTAIGAAVVLIAGAGGAALHFHPGRAPVVSQMPDQLANPSERFSIVVQEKLAAASETGKPSQLQEPQNQAPQKQEPQKQEQTAGAEPAKATEDRPGAATSGAPAVAAPASPPAAEAARSASPAPADLPRLLQTELRRVGCKTGEVDSEWSASAWRALSLFNENAGTKFDVKLASLDALDAVRAKTGRVCPLECERGFRASGDQCVKITCDSDQVLGPNGTCRPRPEHAPNPVARHRPSGGGGGRKCFVYGGTSFCE
jgi:class 3 adenylate cyclase